MNMCGDTNVKGSCSNDPSVYFLFCDFTTKLCNFNNFNMLFLAVLKYLPESKFSNYVNRAFACDVMVAMLVYLDKRILNIFF